MNDPSDDKLDRLLEGWARDRSADAEELHVLQDRIRQRIAASEDSSGALPLAAENTDGWRLGFVSGLATAAMVLAVVGVGRYLLTGAAPGSDGEGAQEVDQETADPRWKKHVLEQAELLARCQELFDGRLAWVVGSGGDSIVELKSGNSAVQDSPFIAIRLQLASREAGAQQWNDLQTIDVLAGQEEWVEVSVQAADQSRISLWAYPAGDEVVSVDMRYGSTSMPDGPVIASNLLRATQPTTVHRFVKDGTEYRLNQTADVVPSLAADKAS